MLHSVCCSRTRRTLPASQAAQAPQLLAPPLHSGRRGLSALLRLGLFGLALALSSRWTEASEPLLADLNTGPELAALLRAQAPAEASETRGWLRVREADRKRREIPVRITTVPGERDWVVVYEIPPTAERPGERLTVIQAVDQAPRYLYQTNLVSGAAAPAGAPPASLAGDQAMVPFAGTDFWLADLGRDFLHWPEQRLVSDVKIKMRKGVACKVLDSIRPDSGGIGYQRVRAWVAVENGGLVYAEAYDSQDRLLKVFEVSGYKKVEGQWHVDELKIRDLRRDSITRLQLAVTVE